MFSPVRHAARTDGKKPATAMKITYRHEKPLFSAKGVMISRKYLTVPGMTFTLGSLGFVRVVRFGNVLSKVLLRKPPTFHLMVGTKSQPAPVSVFKTQDAALIRQIEEAIDTVAKTLNVRKE